MHLRPRVPMFLVLLLLLTACSTGNVTQNSPRTSTPRPTPMATDPALDVCPSPLRAVKNCYTSHALRVAYGLETLTKQGFTGKGQISPTPIVNFPADVPWVTAVGGTSLLRTTNGFDEHTWSRNGRATGGGVSTFFTEPDFQQGMPQAVQKLLAGHRGLPGIAADADPYTGMAFYIAGQWHQVGGTSASTPLWAGLIAVANQMAGHPLGFINPGIYKLGVSQYAQRDFRDITVGNNSIHGKVQVQGFSAMVGWDAVTGWGVPLASQFIPDLIAALR